jgi:hypothetical protein
MPFQALRFVHAASLLVDHQLHDVGPVDDELKPTLIDATVSAFERLVEVCVDQEVDFLLITGDTFCESDRSLRARVVLREGFECLREADIEVFVVPGLKDPPSAWQEFAGLPDNVSLFVPATDEPTAVMRDGNVVATIQACSQRNGMPSRPPESESTGPNSATSTSAVQTLRTSPLRVSIMPPFERHGAEPARARIESLLQSQLTDYVAVPLPYAKLTAIHGERMAHCPGPATSISQRHDGVCGCTLVSIDEEANISARHFATSPVRRERIEIAVEHDTSWDELIATMRERVDQLEQLGAATVVLLDWNLTGTCELLSSFADEEAEAELFELLVADATTLVDVSVSHRLQISAMSDDEAEAAWREQARREANGQKANPFVTGLFRRLDESHSIAHDVVEKARSENADSDSPWVGRLEEIVSRVSPKAVAAHARRHGAAWFQTGPAHPEEESYAEEVSQHEDASEEAVSPTAETHSVIASDFDTHVAPPVPAIAEQTPASEEEYGFAEDDLADDYDDEDFEDEYEAA